MAQSLLRLPTVIERTGYQRSSLYRKIKKGLFPAPIALGPGAVAWPSDVIDAWIAARIAASNEKEAERREAARNHRGEYQKEPA